MSSSDSDTTAPSALRRRPRAIILGIGFFFPGFVFSLPFTYIWADWKWPGDGQSPLGAIVVSFWIGWIAAAVTCVVLLWRAERRR